MQIKTIFFKPLRLLCVYLFKMLEMGILFLCLILNLFRFVLIVNSEFEFAKLYFLVGHICTGIHIDRLDSFLTFLKDRGSQYSMRTCDIAAMQACQLQKVRDEQTRCKFTCVISVVFRITRFTARGRVQYIFCGRRLLLSDMQFFYNTAHIVLE